MGIISGQFSCCFNSDLGREVFWVPHMVEELHIDTNSVLIGHGIGASAVLRLILI